MLIFLFRYLHLLLQEEQFMNLVRCLLFLQLRNGPGVIYPSRNLLDKTSEELILEQIKHKVHGNSWNECDGKSDELELQSAADSAKVFGFGGDNVLGS